MRKLSLLIAAVVAVSSITTRAQNPGRLLPRLTGFDVVEDRVVV